MKCYGVRSPLVFLCSPLQSLTEYAGEPLPLQEQKDVDEFATLLFDKLESLDPRVDQLLKGLLYGVLVRREGGREGRPDEGGREGRQEVVSILICFPLFALFSATGESNHLARVPSQE